jgi:hypothetical protein
MKAHPMAIFLILAPYGVFALLMLMSSATMSLFAAAATCLVAIAIDAARGRSIKILGAGSALLFAGLGLYLFLMQPAMSPSAVKLAVDSGIVLISIGSMLIGRPFTLQYAIETVPAETAAMPGFLRANYIITGAWTAAALLMMAGNIAMLYVPGLPFWSSLAIAFAARNSALYFTRWYPDYSRIKHEGTAAAAPTIPNRTI